MDKLLESLDKRQPQEPEEAQSPALPNREKEIDEFEQKLGELKEAIARHLTQQLMAVGEAVSQQPELLLTDNESKYRRKMSQVAAQPVRDASPFDARGSIVEGWAALDIEVLTLARSHFPQPLCWGRLSPMLQERFLRLTPKAKLYLEDEFMCLSIFQAWVWHILDGSVFSNAKGPWMGEHWAAYSQLQNLAAHLALPQDTEWTIRYHVWRNLTVSMVQHITGDDGRLSIESAVQGLKDELGPVLDLKEGHPLPGLDGALGNIAKYAVEVDVCMQFDRTDWAVIWRHPDGAEYGFPFDPTKRGDSFGMTASRRVHLRVSKEKLNGRPVELVVVPLLQGRGTEGGFAYHVASPHHPMQVVINWFPEDEGPRDAAGGAGHAGPCGGDRAGVAKIGKCSNGTEQS